MSWTAEVKLLLSGLFDTSRKNADLAVSRTGPCAHPCMIPLQSAVFGTCREEMSGGGVHAADHSNQHVPMFLRCSGCVHVVTVNVQASEAST